MRKNVREILDGSDYPLEIYVVRVRHVARVEKKNNMRKVTSEMDKAENYWVLCASMTTQEADRSIADYVSINVIWGGAGGGGGGDILACRKTHIRFYARLFYAIGESSAREVPIHLSFCRNFNGK